MTVLLGASFVPRRPVVTDEEPLAPIVPTDTERILAALLDLRAALSTPAPVVQHVLPPPDLSAVVTAVAKSPVSVGWRMRIIASCTRPRLCCACRG